jgi:hypothetical protein
VAKDHDFVDRLVIQEHGHGAARLHQKMSSNLFWIETKCFVATKEVACVLELSEEKGASNVHSLAGKLDSIDGGRGNSLHSMVDPVDQGMKAPDRTENFVTSFLLGASIILVTIFLVNKGHCQVFSTCHATLVGDDTFLDVPEDDVANIKHFGFSWCVCVVKYSHDLMAKKKATIAILAAATCAISHLMVVAPMPPQSAKRCLRSLGVMAFCYLGAGSRLAKALRRELIACQKAFPSLT